jgi:glyoxylase-like metal-dependent hydrolase (beta-lactamase superfamily II)
MQRIRKGLYLLESAKPVNCYLIEGSHGLTLFDTGQPLAAPRLIEEIENNAFDIKDIEAIVISHGHIDHAGGAHGLLERHRVKVFAHPADIPSIQGRRQFPPKSLKMRLYQVLMRIKSPYRPIGVILPIDQGQTLRTLPQWQILRLPGHTAGSIGLFQPAKRLLLAGDALNTRGGGISLPEDENCDDSAMARESVRKLGLLDLEVLCCGHGPVIQSGAGLRIQEFLSRPE